MPDIQARLKLRAGTAAAWASANPVLAAGEPGFETDTGTLRIGDGSSVFLLLEKFQTSDGFTSTFQPIGENLTALSSLTLAANKLPYGTGIGTMAITDFTAEARILLAAITKADQRAALGLKTGAITDTNASDDFTTNIALIPTRGSVGAAILKVGGPAKRIVFTASGTFIKADHGQFPSDHLIFVEAWGGGGGGAAGGGGGGGEYDGKWVRFADVPASVSIVIGSGGGNGGAAGGGGGNTLFGSLVTAFGGKGGIHNDTVDGGGYAGAFGGGFGSTGTGGFTKYGGGGGGGESGGTATNGGNSRYGGNGGGRRVNGTIPAGGGGSFADGARGEVRVYL